MDARARERDLLRGVARARSVGGTLTDFFERVATVLSDVGVRALRFAPADGSEPIIVKIRDGKPVRTATATTTMRLPGLYKLAVCFGAAQLGELQIVGGHLEADTVESIARYVGERVADAPAEDGGNDDFDPLGGLLSEEAFGVALEEAWAAARASRTPLALLIADIDHFRAYNDAYGYVAGNAALRQVSQLALDRLRPGDVAARFETHGLALLLPNADATSARAIATELRNAVAGLHFVHERSSLGHISLTVGLAAVIPTPANGPRTLIEGASRALESAKAAGRNRIGPMRDGDGCERADLRSPVGHNLPGSRGALLGREAERARIVAFLEENRFVCVCGPAGVGKSRLAMQIARDLVDRYADGVRYVDLAQATTRDAVNARLLEALDASGVDAARAAVRRGRRLLLLDNANHAGSETRALVRDLLDAGSELHVLATARASLNFEGARCASIAPLEPTVATRLFIARAGDADPAFSLDRTDPAAVVEIVRALGGIPLAIELAAATIRDAGLPALRAAARTFGADPLRATIAWRIGRLTDHERQLVLRLGAMPGSVTIEAVRALDGDGADTGILLETVHGLVDSSVLRVAMGTPRRYQLPEPIREQAVAMLDASAEAPRIRARVVAYGLRLAIDADVNFLRTPLRRWLDGLDAESEIVDSAWEAGRAARDVAVIVTLAFRLRRYLAHRPLKREAWCGVLADLLMRADGLPGEARAYAWVTLSTLQGDEDPAAAIATTEAAVAAAERDGTPALLAEALLDLSLRLLRTADRTAIDVARRALATATTAGDAFLRAMASMRLGQALGDFGADAYARRAYEEAASLFETLGRDDQLAMITGNLGVLAFRHGDYATAARLAGESVASRVALGSPPAVIAWQLMNLGIYEAFRGNVVGARVALRDALEIMRDARAPYGTAVLFWFFAYLALVLKRPIDAATLAGYSENLSVALEAPLRAIADDVLARAKVEAGASFAPALTRGKAMDMDQASALALTL